MGGVGVIEAKRAERPPPQSNSSSSSAANGAGGESSGGFLSAILNSHGLLMAVNGILLGFVVVQFATIGFLLQPTFYGGLSDGDSAGGGSNGGLSSYFFSSIGSGNTMSSAFDSGGSYDVDIPKRMDVLMSVSEDGNSVKEFAVVLKSVLMNAPLDYDLDVHVLVADGDAETAVRTLYSPANANFTSWKMRNRVAVHTYNVESLTPLWSQKVRSALPTESSLERNGAFLGGDDAAFSFLCRMFADQVLPDQVGMVVSIANSVVIMSDLDDLWSRVGGSRSSNSYLFMMGGDGNDQGIESNSQEEEEERHEQLEIDSGIIVLNSRKSDLLWKEAAKVLPKLDDFGNAFGEIRGNMLQQQSKHRVGELPPQWHLTIHDSGTMKQIGRHNASELLVRNNPNGVGMLHFSTSNVKPDEGKGKGREDETNEDDDDDDDLSDLIEDIYYAEHSLINGTEIDSPIGLVKYYVGMPWVSSHGSVF